MASIRPTLGAAGNPGEIQLVAEVRATGEPVEGQRTRLRGNGGAACGAAELVSLEATECSASASGPRCSGSRLSAAIGGHAASVVTLFRGAQAGAGAAFW